MIRALIGRSIVVATCTLLLVPGQLEAGEQSVPGEKIGDLIIQPLVLGWQDKVIYVDPVGGAKAFNGLPEPDLILLTDIHGDHLNPATVSQVKSDRSRIVAPAAVAGRLNEPAQKLANGQKITLAGIQIEAVPMYNLTEQRKRFHSKGRGNGYVLTLGKQRVYISGDTEDIPEMRALKNIDVAFVCMNLPYTMTVDQAADAVLEFQPKVVYPYHYRNRGGQLSDVERFKKLVSRDRGIEVRLRNSWYD